MLTMINNNLIIIYSKNHRFLIHILMLFHYIISLNFNLYIQFHFMYNLNLNKNWINMFMAINILQDLINYHMHYLNMIHQVNKSKFKYKELKEINYYNLLPAKLRTIMMNINTPMDINSKNHTLHINFSYIIFYHLKILNIITNLYKKLHKHFKNYIKVHYQNNQLMFNMINLLILNYQLTMMLLLILMLQLQKVF